MRSRNSNALLCRYRWVLGFFIIALVISGVTAFPLLRELNILLHLRGIPDVAVSAPASGWDRWLVTVRDGLRVTYTAFPWMAYGTDWLAFAHLVLAIFFVGPFRDPVRNVWVLHAGIAACVLVIPLALICGEIRGIPLGWRLIDCSFGVIGILPLLYCVRLTRRMEQE